MAACEREAVQPALGTPAVYLGWLRLATSERKEDSTRDQIGFLRAAGAPPYPRSSVLICVDLWSLWTRRSTRRGDDSWARRGRRRPRSLNRAPAGSRASRRDRRGRAAPC